MKKCEKIYKGEVFVLDAFIHIFILCLILGSFFFFFVSNIERQALNDQMENGIKKGLEDYNPSKDVILADQLDDLSNLYKNENPVEKTYNDGLITQCIIVLVLLLFGLLCVWATMKFSAHKCPNVGKLLLQNLLLFGSVGVIEFLFFENYASKFIPVMPSYMGQVISDDI